MCPAGREAGAVLLTRPAGYNDTLAGQLEAARFPVIQKPLLEIAGTPLDQRKKQLIMDLDQFDDIVFVSANAVEYGIQRMEQYWPQWPVALRWFAVGPATADRLQVRADVQALFPERGASDALLDRPEFQSVANRRILIVRGVGGREMLADTLRARGADVQYLEVYERKPVPYDSDFVRAMAKNDIDWVVMTSGEALTHFAQLVAGTEISATILVPSERVQTMAIELGFAKVKIVGDMSDDGIIRSIVETSRNDPQK